MPSRTRCCVLSRVRLCGPVDYSHQASLSMGFSKQKYWSGLSFAATLGLISTTFFPIIFGRVVPLLLLRLLSGCSERGLVSSCDVWASRCGGISPLQSTGSRALWLQ